MTKYPYYILAYFDAGILRKVFNDKKFDTYNDCHNAYERRLNNYKKDPFCGRYYEAMSKQQYMILEYTDQYKGKIINIIENGHNHRICEPVKYDTNF